tara:strand:+ start:69 stop:632 length:564 start_codon:yes stop_codon:yes gene_type:complete
MPMNYLDIIIVILIFYGLVRGFSNGIIIEVSNIISVFFAIYIGAHFSQLIYPYLSLKMLKDYTNIVPLVAFFLVFLIILVIVKSLGEILNKISKQLALGFLSRILGAFFGMLKMLLICLVLLFLVVDYEVLDKQTQKKSILFIPLQSATQVLIPEFKKHKKTIIKSAKESTKKAKETIEKRINTEQP